MCKIFAIFSVATVIGVVFRVKAEPSSQVNEVLLYHGEGRTAQAYLDLGRLGDLTAVPILEQSVFEELEWRRDHPEASRNPGIARQALARMRVKDYYQQVLNESVALLDKQGNADENSARIEAFQALAYIGGKDAIHIAAKYLFDDSQPTLTSPHVVYPRNNEMAALVLAAWIPEGPAKDPAGQAAVRAWRNWWKQYGDHFTNGEQSVTNSIPSALHIESHFRDSLSSSLTPMPQNDTFTDCLRGRHLGWKLPVGVLVVFAGLVGLLLQWFRSRRG